MSRVSATRGSGGLSAGSYAAAGTLTKPVPAAAKDAPSSFLRATIRMSDRADRVSLRALGPLGDFEFDPLVLLQGPVAAGLDGREVDKHVRTIVLRDEAETLFGVEPLHGALCHGVFSSKSSLNDAHHACRRLGSSLGPHGGLWRHWAVQRVRYSSETIMSTLLPSCSAVYLSSLSAAISSAASR